MKIFDAHFHIIDHAFPVQENQGYMPPNYPVAAYLEDTKNLPIAGGAIVSGSFQGFDQSYLLHALQQLGSNYCGVTQLPASVTDAEILSLHKKGVRALRFNIQRGGSEDLKQLDYFARRVHEVAGWHSELYIDARLIPDIEHTIRTLPAVSIDHLGLSEEGLPHLLRLVERGVRVKATGFGRVALDVRHALLAIHEVNKEALLFGTDLPSTRAKRPFETSDITLIQQLFSEKEAQRILYDNAHAWYFKK